MCLNINCHSQICVAFDPSVQEYQVHQKGNCICFSATQYFLVNSVVIDAHHYPVQVVSTLVHISSNFTSDTHSYNYYYCFTGLSFEL